jgi:hypothetical protein
VDGVNKEDNVGIVIEGSTIPLLVFATLAAFMAFMVAGFAFFAADIRNQFLAEVAGNKCVCFREVKPTGPMERKWLYFRTFDPLTACFAQYGRQVLGSEYGSPRHGLNRTY